jgi:SAM-dependent methyltransferase
MSEVELIVSANGCTDNTGSYLNDLAARFKSIGFEKHLKVIWHDKPLGYSGANNVAIPHATADKIVLLNNDTVLLHQTKNQWLQMLDKPFQVNQRCGISCVIKGPSEPAGRDFAVFFCVMVHRRVFDAIGLLNVEYGVGGGEDTEFCIEAEKAGFEVCECSDKVWDGTQFTGAFPIYHKGEGTVHDPNLVKGWDSIFLRNSLKLAKKYNRDWYRWRLSNYWERAVFLKGDPVFPRESTRYQWAASHAGRNILEIGCSSGYGSQFMPDKPYIGLDYDPIIVDVANEQQWTPHCQFHHADINTYPFDQYDTIIAFEVIEHLDNGLEILQKLKQHCRTLLFTVPMNEPPGFWGPHHKLHGLNESHFPGFHFEYIDEEGAISTAPKAIDDKNRLNLLIGRWHA